MKIRYPKYDLLKKNIIDWNNLPIIPTKHSTESGYYLIALASEGNTGYVVFTNQNHSEVWIEKFSNLTCIDFFHFEMLEKIDDDEEFQYVYEYFQKIGVLDGAK